jgi:hypothetical protein
MNAFVVEDDYAVCLYDDARLEGAIGGFFDDGGHDADDIFYLLMKPMRDDYERKCSEMLAYIAVLESTVGVKISFATED